MKKKRIVIIPVHNAEKTIEAIMRDLQFEIPSIHYVIIDDGSTDKTVDICKIKHYNLISLENKVGLKKALQTGYKFAVKHNYDYVIRFDGSGAYNPKDIIKLEKEIDDKFDIMFGNKFKNKNKPFTISILSKQISLSTNKVIQDPETGISIANIKVVKNLLKSKGEYFSTPFIIEQIKDGYTIKEIEVENVKTKNDYFKQIGFTKAISQLFIHWLFKPFKR